jgi:hypothetical protein
MACTEGTPSTGKTAQEAVSRVPLDLNLFLNAKKTLTIGAEAFVEGDVGASGPTGAVIFTASSDQSSSGNAVANRIDVQAGADAGHVFGNDLTIDGDVREQAIGVDPAALPQVPSATVATPGTTNVTVAAGHITQLCAGQYGAISLQSNATLNLNGGVYHLTKLTLADGASLQPSEPVLIVIAGALNTGTNSTILPLPDAVNPMGAQDIRIEVGGSVTTGEGSEVHAHLLIPGGKITTGKSSRFFGAAWANNITLGAESEATGEGTFSLQPAVLPPACNDNNACTVDQCVGGGTAIGFCRTTPVAIGTSCADGNNCNGDERCDAAGQCQPGTNATPGTSCADGDLCNGDETCNGFGDCLTGDAPVVNDGNTCTTDACDPVTGVSNTALPDGTACARTGTCTAGECSVQSITFSEQLSQGVSTTAQCTAWNNFLGTLNNGGFHSVTISGTFDTVGVTCNEPAAANRICQAMHDGSSMSVFCNGRNWGVGQCGGTEVTANGFVCSCGTGYTARPCTGSGDWGGANTNTCFGPSQTLTVSCE